MDNLILRGRECVDGRASKEGWTRRERGRRRVLYGSFHYKGRMWRPPMKIKAGTRKNVAARAANIVAPRPETADARSKLLIARRWSFDRRQMLTLPVRRTLRSHTDVRLRWTAGNLRASGINCISAGISRVSLRVLSFHSRFKIVRNSIYLIWFNVPLFCVSLAIDICFSAK